MKKEKIKFEVWALDKAKHYQKLLKLEHFYPLQLEHVPKHTGAESQFYYPYTSITIRYGDTVKKYYEDGNEEMALKILVHELCHAITDPLYAKCTSRYVSKDEIEDERERLTDQIANIVLTNAKT